MANSYFTIAEKSEGFYKEKGSKFISLAFPVKNEDEVKAIQEDLRKKYYDARHHCFAYILGVDQSNYRANDDGEPNHSAGDPILGQIRAFNLSNVLIVVIRYFGGTKLGVGGLISAYKTASELALKNVKIIEKFISQRVNIETNFEDYNCILRLTKFEGFKIVSQDFNVSNIKMDIEIYKKDMIEIEQLKKELYKSVFTIIK